MIRRAGPGEYQALYALEKVASLASLAHIFPADTSPFPDADVQARYRLWFADPSFRCLVAEQNGRLTALVAYDPAQLRQLSVHPRQWGTGLGTRILRACLDDVASLGSERISLWVLADNHRARRFYEREGWHQTSETTTSQFAPYPAMVGYQFRLVG